MNKFHLEAIASTQNHVTILFSVKKSGMDWAWHLQLNKHNEMKETNMILLIQKLVF